MQGGTEASRYSGESGRKDTSSRRKRDLRHLKPLIHKDPSFPPQIEHRKRDLRSPIYVSTDWFEVNF